MSRYSHRIALLLLTSLLLSSPDPTAAQKCLAYEDYLHWSGGVTTSYESWQDTHGYTGLALFGDHAVMALMGFGLEIADFSDPTHPVMSSELETDFGPTGVFVKGTFAFVTGVSGQWPDFVGEILIVDIEDPAEPVPTGSLTLPDPAYAIAVGNEHALVGTTAGLEIINVGDPHAPQPVASLAAGPVEDVIYAGNVAYLATGTTGLVVVDVSSFSAPRILATYDTPDRALANDRLGNLLVLADVGAVLFFDVSAPEFPQLLGSFDDVSEALDVCLGQGRAYIADGYRGVKVVDLTDPSQPALLGNLITPRAEAAAVAHRDGHVLVAEYTNYWYVWPEGVYAMATDPFEVPPRRGNVPIFLQTDQLELSGDHAIVYGDGSVYTIGIADPDHPNLITTFDPDWVAFDTVLGGDFLYASGFYAFSDDGILVIDYSNPAAPVRRGIALLTTAQPRDLALSYPFLYGARSSLGVVIVDVGDPDAPGIVADLDAGDSVKAVAVHQGYLITGGQRLQTFDLADPLSPAPVGNLDELPGISALTVAGDLVLASCGQDELAVVDISDPASPVLRGRLSTLVRPLQVAVAGGVAYAACEAGGVQVIDLADPDNPWLIGTATSSYKAYGVAAVEGAVFSVGISRPQSASLGFLSLYPQCTGPTAVEPETATSPSGRLTVWPNPANPQVTVRFSVTEAGPIEVTVFDLRGRRVVSLATGILAAGEYERTWNVLDKAGIAVATGVYLVTIRDAAGLRVQKVAVVR